ncbi:hypothetical protein [Sulfurimonas sp. HSL3-7]|uniref:hypothetical protein n=1 Tax=Sulfonitrofixus jiaomeiensis TaxID=3131938 RepID=UPI0031F7D86A
MDNSDTGLCRFLSAKGPYGPLEGGRSRWHLIGDADSVYRCIKSTEDAGPDNGLVDPSLCRRAGSATAPKQAK